MTVADHEAVRRLSARLGRTAAPERFGTGECQLVLKDAAGQLLGWARAHCWEPQDALAPAGYYLGGVEVAVQSRQQGIARRLGIARLDWIAQRASAAWCVANAQNTASLALQRSLGFIEVARAVRFGSVVLTGGSGVLLRKDLDALDASGIAQE